MKGYGSLSSAAIGAATQISLAKISLNPNKVDFISSGNMWLAVKKATQYSGHMPNLHANTRKAII